MYLEIERLLIVSEAAGAALSKAKEFELEVARTRVTILAGASQRARSLLTNCRAEARLGGGRRRAVQQVWQLTLSSVR
jgi:hypothetical protein